MPQSAIRNRTVSDPACDLIMVDAYMNWALQAAEDVVGKQGLNVVLRDAGLERFIDNYPEPYLTASGKLTFADYANLSAGLLLFYGRGGKSMTMRIGRLSTKYSIEQQGQMIGVMALRAAKVLPLPMQMRLGLETLHAVYQVLMPGIQIRVEDRGDKWVWVCETCPYCAGKEADEHICWGFNGVLHESTYWLTGYDFNFEEVECCATGGHACVWEISKTPKE